VRQAHPLRVAIAPEKLKIFPVQLRLSKGELASLNWRMTPVHVNFDEKIGYYYSIE
jgi:hypothetical protein